MSEYQPEAGQWRLISPSGRVHVGSSPMRALQEEQRTRIPVDVALARIHQAIAPTFEDKAELDAHMEKVAEYGSVVADYQAYQSSIDEIEKRFAAVRSSALKLMGLSDD